MHGRFAHNYFQLIIIARTTPITVMVNKSIKSAINTPKMTAKKAPVKKDDVPVFLKKVSDKIDGMSAAGTTTISIVPNQRQRHRVPPPMPPRCCSAPRCVYRGCNGGCLLTSCRWTAVSMAAAANICSAAAFPLVMLHITMIAIYSPPLLALVISYLSSLCRLFT